MRDLLSEFGQTNKEIRDMVFESDFSELEKFLNTELAEVTAAIASGERKQGWSKNYSSVISKLTELKDVNPIKVSQLMPTYERLIDISNGYIKLV
jgi:hypothetical protein